MADGHGIWDQIAGGWKQFRGEVRKQWADLTDDDMEYIGGQRDKLEGKLQERYGIAKQEASDQIDNWEAAFNERFPRNG